MCKDTSANKVILVFSFGSFGSKETRGNCLLGSEASSMAREERAVAVITQKDIPNNISKDFLCPLVYVEDFMREDGWHSTLWVAKTAKLFCSLNRFPMKAVVIAAPMHLRRAVRDARKSGFDVVCGRSPNSDNSWYEKKSELPWTRSWWRWWIREIPLRLLPWWLYKRLTLKN